MNDCDAAEMRVENARLKETLTRLNRRCQEAESAARTKVDEVLRAGPSLGRALSAWAAGDCRRRLEAAVSALSLQSCGCAAMVREILEAEVQR